MKQNGFTYDINIYKLMDVCCAYIAANPSQKSVVLESSGQPRLGLVGNPRTTDSENSVG